MATETAVSNPAVKQIERVRDMTWTALNGQPYACEARFEVVRLDSGDNVVFAGPGGLVTRLHDRVKDATVNVNSKTISVADLVAAQAAFVDQWRAEDLVPPPPEGRR